ncbi:hypothetical protein J6590_094719 [Homalodisca vitripennis]|nr:hypothetical protein J6590_094719 [Homalodisca vitripennis]
MSSLGVNVLRCTKMSICTAGTEVPKSSVAAAWMVNRWRIHLCKQQAARPLLVFGSYI